MSEKESGKKQQGIVLSCDLPSIQIQSERLSEPLSFCLAGGLERLPEEVDKSVGKKME